MASARSRLDPADLALLDECRVARLATADRDARPHVVPLCYAVVDESTLVFAIDEKRKPSGRPLRRMRNLAENDRFALVADRWDEDWARLAWILIEGVASPIDDLGEREAAIDALRARYPQYGEMGLDASRHPVVRLAVSRVRRWTASD